MSDNSVISNKPPASPATDYEALRRAGMAYIEQYAHALWTDYNKHDPGVTTLEMLCYAITDLSLRTQLPMRDLLTSSFGSPDALCEAFATADLALPSCPVTELDYRKLFIDIPGVRNAWLTKGHKTVHVNCKESVLSHVAAPSPGERWTQFDLNGLYDILISFDPIFIQIETAATGNTEAVVRDAILASVKAAYLDNRLLCEDWNSVAEVPIQRVMICADVDLATDAVISAVYAQILLVVQNYLDPPVKRYSLAEMQAKTDTDGLPLTIDRIFEGPLLTQGFILDDELEAAGLRASIRTSDLIQLIMGIPGVKAVKKVRINSLLPDPSKPCGAWKTVDPEGEKWCLHLAEGHQAQLCYDKVALAFYKDLIPVGSLSDKAKALEQLEALQLEAYLANQKQVDELPVPTGSVFEIGAYTSVANDFPRNYGIGPYGLPASAGTARHAQAKQMKAYLLFFDQILANYLAQLVQLKSLFAAEESPATYFAQPVTDMPGIAELYYDDPGDLTDGYANLDATLREILKEEEGFEDNPLRKNRFLDHLLGRFAENFSDYALLMFSLYGERTGEEVLQDKVAFLREFYQCPPRASGESFDDWKIRCREYFHERCRARAFHYCRPAWENDNVSSVVRRIARLSGIRSYQAYPASEVEIIHARKVTPIGGGSGPDKYRYHVHEGDSATPMLIYTTSRATFDSAEDAERAAYRDLVFNPPQRAHFEFRKMSKGWVHALHQDATLSHELARSPQFFPSEAAARDAADALLERLIYGGESIFVVEHLLLRPDAANPAEAWMHVCTEPDCTSCKPLDPYSYRVSVVLPGYTARFANIDYRRYLERLIRTELPAHVLARICWVGRDQLAVFEEKYKNWLAAKAQTCDVKDPDAYATALNELLQIMDELYSVYPTGVLHDCDNPDEERPIILGQSSLGSL